MRDDCMGIGEARPNIVWFELRMVVDDRLGRLTLSKKTQDRLDGDAHPSDDRLSAEDVRIVSDTCKQPLVLVYPFDGTIDQARPSSLGEFLACNRSVEAAATTAPPGSGASTTARAAARGRRTARPGRPRRRRACRQRPTGQTRGDISRASRAAARRTTGATPLHGRRSASFGSGRYGRSTARSPRTPSPAPGSPRACPGSPSGG